MSDIRFYHLERQGLAHVLPQLLHKILQGGRRAVVKGASEESIESLDLALWTHDRPEGFLPHGCAKGGHEQDQPVWLTQADDNPNGAEVLVLVEGASWEALWDSQTPAPFAVVCEIFDGTHADAVSLARTRWTLYKEAGHTVTYWQQGSQGWEKKA